MRTEPHNTGHSDDTGHTDTTGKKRSRWALAAAIIGLHVAGTVVARRRGYPLGGNVVVRCRAGHLFTTIWIPGASFKALRLGPARFQRCPVGPHWSLVTPVKTANLTDEERETAAARRDIRIP
jgi:hypothetical protein